VLNIINPHELGKSTQGVTVEDLGAESFPEPPVFLWIIHDRASKCMGHGMFLPDKENSIILCMKYE
jgi:hypothetical protein